MMSVAEEATTEQLEMAALGLPRRSLTTWLVLALTAVLIAVAIAGVLLRRENNADADVDAARAQASLAATESVAELFSYDYRTIAQDLPERAALLTGDFADAYDELVTTQVIPAASKQKLVTRTDVAVAAVISAQEDEVRLLLFLNQTSGKAGSDLPVLAGSRVEVEMKRVDGSWRVAAVKPV
jgi:Mce-associated membrane protein